MTIHKCSLNISVQETAYKICSSWYRTPVVLPNTCWRCQKDEGSLLHIWWMCPLFRPFWEGVYKVLFLTGTTPAFTPAQYLLHYEPHTTSYRTKSLTMHLINAARQCSTKYWRTQTCPSLRDWWVELQRWKGWCMPPKIESPGTLELGHNGSNTRPPMTTLACSPPNSAMH